MWGHPELLQNDSRAGEQILPKKVDGHARHDGVGTAGLIPQNPAAITAPSRCSPDPATWRSWGGGGTQDGNVLRRAGQPDFLRGSSKRPPPSNIVRLTDPGGVGGADKRPLRTARWACGQTARMPTKREIVGQTVEFKPPAKQASGNTAGRTGWPILGPPLNLVEKAEVNNDHAVTSRRLANVQHSPRGPDQCWPRNAPAELWLTPRSIPACWGPCGGNQHAGPRGRELDGQPSAVYDVFAQRQAGREFTADLRDSHARLYAILPRPIGDVRLTAPASVKAGQPLDWSLAVLDDQGQRLPSTVPVHVRLLDGESAVVEERFSAAEPSGNTAPIVVPVNLPLGDLTLEAAELISGRSARVKIAVEAMLARRPGQTDHTGPHERWVASPRLFALRSPMALRLNEIFGPHLRNVAGQQRWPHGVVWGVQLGREPVRGRPADGRRAGASRWAISLRTPHCRWATGLPCKAMT